MCVSCVRGGVGVGVSSVCVGVCVCVCRCVAGAGWGLPLVWVWVWLVCAVVGPSLLLAEVPKCDFRHSWPSFAVGGGGCSSPLLAEGPGCGYPPLLAGVRWWRRCVVACHSWRRVPVAVSRHSWLEGPLMAVLGGPLPLLAEGLGGGSPPLLPGVRQPQRWVFPRVGVSRVLCACGAACACGACAGVCGVVCVRGVCVGGGVGVGGPSACVCVCVRVSVCGVLVACSVVRCGVLVGLWLVCGMVGP